MEFVFLGNTYKVSEYTIDKSGRLSFACDKVAANLMVDLITATLYAKYDGVEYASASVEYGVITYATRQIDKATGKSRVLLCDLLNYGAAAQIYNKYKTDNLVTKDFTAEQLSGATKDDPKVESIKNAAYEVIDNATAEWKAVGLLLESAVTVRYKFQAEDITGLVAKFTADGCEYEIPYTEFELVKGTTNQYYIYFKGLHAGQMRSEIHAKLYDKDGNLISNTARYSIESYIAEKYNNTNADLVALIKAMIKYGDSAYNFNN